MRKRGDSYGNHRGGKAAIGWSSGGERGGIGHYFSRMGRFNRAINRQSLKLGL
jgi:hypothetical protein